jgi:hypothetical protein
MTERANVECYDGAVSKPKVSSALMPEPNNRIERQERAIRIGISRWLERRFTKYSFGVLSYGAMAPMAEGAQVGCFFCIVYYWSLSNQMR